MPAARKKKRPVSPPPVSILGRLRGGPKYLAGLVIAAIVPVVALGVLAQFRNAVGGEFDYVVTYDNEAGVDYSRVVPSTVPADQVRELLGEDRFFQVGSLSSVKVGEQGIKLTLGGKRSDRVKVVGMRAVILDKAPPTTGTLFQYGAEGEANVNLGFDLKAPIPTARTANQGGVLGEPYFRTNSEPLDLSSSTTFEIIAYPGPYTYTWEIEVDLFVEGKTQTKRIRPTDGPFRVSGYATTYQAAYRWDRDADDGSPWTAQDSSNVCKLVPTTCQPTR